MKHKKILKKQYQSKKYKHLNVCGRMTFLITRKMKIILNIRMWLLCRLNKPWAFTNCIENPVIPWRIQMEWFIPMEIFRIKVTPFKVLSFSRFYRKKLWPKFFVPFVWLTSAARLPLEAVGAWFVLTQAQF